MKIIKQIIKNIVHFIHLLISIFTVVGFLMPDRFLFYYILCWPSIYVHWQFNNQRCILNDIKYYLDDKIPPPGNKDEYPYIQKQLLNIGIKAQNVHIHYFYMYGISAFWMIGLLRYIYIKNKKVDL